MEVLASVLDKYKLGKTSEALRKEVAKVNQPAPSDEQLLGIMRKAIVNKQKKRMRDENKENNFKYKPPKSKDDMSFNKEETEAIMERLMNRIVANPKLTNENSELNQRIEKIFNLEAFQKMVENADIFQDLSSSSLFSNSQLLQKSMMSQNTQNNQLLQQASLHEMSDGESHNLDGDIMTKSHEDSLLKLDSHTEHKADPKDHKRDEHAAAKQYKEDRKTKRMEKKPEKTHTTSHEEAAPMRNAEMKANKEETKKVSQKISKELTRHQEESKDSLPTEYENDPDPLDGVEEYENDEDPGFTTIIVKKEDMDIQTRKIALKYGYPERAFRASTAQELKARELKAKEAEEK